jgi:hypothetical protein
MVIAHIAGLPVEETLLALAPVGAAGVGAVVASWFHRVRLGAWSRRTRRSGS